MTYHLWPIALTAGALLCCIVGLKAGASLARRKERSGAVSEFTALSVSSAASRRSRSAPELDFARVQVIVFDATSALVAIRDRRNPWREIARRSKRPLDPRRADCSIQNYAAASGVEWHPIWAEDVTAERESIEPFAGAFTALEELRGLGFRLAAISNLPKEHVVAVQSLLGDRLDAITHSAEHPGQKPGPALLARLLSELRASPAEVLLVGDLTASGVAGLTKTGVQAIHLERHGAALPERVTSMAGLIEHLACARLGAAS